MCVTVSQALWIPTSSSDSAAAATPKSPSWRFYGRRMAAVRGPATPARQDRECPSARSASGLTGSPFDLANFILKHADPRVD
jgi:hypothetical protein